MTSALIVIDVQRALFETTPAPADADAVLARINTLTDRARACGAPVIYVQPVSYTHLRARDRG